MDPETAKPDQENPNDAEPTAGSKPERASREIASKESEQVDVERRTLRPRMDERQLAKVSRRELLKVAPVLVLGAFAIPGLQESLLKKGLGFSDWASKQLFRRGHLATTFADAKVTPFEKFPINGYDVDDPGVIFENWTLTVTGAVQKPGEYRLEQIQTLPRTRQNTRHVCVEGWDVIGRFGGRLGDMVVMADSSCRTAPHGWWVEGG